MSKIENLFEDVAIVQPGGWTIYAKKDAKRFVEECKTRSLKILGIDGFILTENVVQPSLDDSIDFSSSTYESLKDCYSAAMSFFEERDESVFFEIVYEPL